MYLCFRECYNKDYETSLCLCLHTPVFVCVSAYISVFTFVSVGQWCYGHSFCGFWPNWPLSIKTWKEWKINSPEMAKWKLFYSLLLPALIWSLVHIKNQSSVYSTGCSPYLASRPCCSTLVINIHALFIQFSKQATLRYVHPREWLGEQVSV